MSGARWFVVVGVVAFVLSWVLLDIANAGRRFRQSPGFVTLGGFLLGFVGLLFVAVGVHGDHAHTKCDDGLTSSSDCS